jgi:threonine dehydratase
MGPNTVFIMIGVGGLIAALVVYLLYSSFKRA